MDLKRIQGFENLMPTAPTGSLGSVGGVSPQGKGPSFKDTLDQVSKNPAASGAKEASALQNFTDGVKFSNHAVERMKTRGISFKPEDLSRLNDAIGRAASKGSKDSLILMNDSALIVSVKNKTVVTVMDKTALKENVFTNIDSTIVM